MIPGTKLSRLTEKLAAWGLQRQIDIDFPLPKAQNRSHLSNKLLVNIWFVQEFQTIEYKDYSTRCKETITSFISHKSCTRLYFFIPKIEMLHELLKGIHSACSFKFLIIGFNPFLNSGFSRYCFLCGNKCRSLSLTTTEIAFYA